MSAKGGINAYLRCDFDRAIDDLLSPTRWGRAQVGEDCAYYLEDDGAGYLEDEMGYIAGQLDVLKTIGALSPNWELEVIYDSYEDYPSSGTHFEFLVKEGGIEYYRENEMIIVDKPVPSWLSTKLEGGEA